MHYSSVTLPQERKELVGCYLYLSIQLRALWVEYVIYTEQADGPTDSSVYRMIFAEMDFFEGLRQRVAEKLPLELIESLRNIDDYSSW